MLVTPLPGGRDNLLSNLKQIREALNNAITANSSVEDRHKAYLDAIGNGAHLLRGQVRSADIQALLQSRRYWALVEMTTSENPPNAVVGDLLSLEIAERLTELDETISSSGAALNRWPANAGFLALADTSFHLRNPHVLDNIDFPQLLDTDETITVLIPEVVIDELDRAKRRRDDQRHKATVALAVFERYIRDGFSAMWTEGPDTSKPGRGAIWFDVLINAREYVPLPTADAEIIDRAVSVQDLAGRAVTLLTYDTGQAFRARRAGICVRRLGD